MAVVERNRGFRVTLESKDNTDLRKQTSLSKHLLLILKHTKKSIFTITNIIFIHLRCLNVLSTLVMMSLFGGRLSQDVYMESLEI